MKGFMALKIFFLFLFSIDTLCWHAMAFQSSYIPGCSTRKFQSSSMDLIHDKKFASLSKQIGIRSAREKRAVQYSSGAPKMLLGLSSLAFPTPPVIIGSALMAIFTAAWYWLSVPSRTYVDGEGTVGKEYDAWTEEGILEYYWVSFALYNPILSTHHHELLWPHIQGEHIHLGYYNDEDRRAVFLPWKSGKVFKETKYK